MGRHVVSVIVASDGRLDVRVAIVASAALLGRLLAVAAEAGPPRGSDRVRVGRCAGTAGAATTTTTLDGGPAAGPRQERARVQPTAGAASRGLGANCGAARQVVRRRVIGHTEESIVLYSPPVVWNAAVSLRRGTRFTHHDPYTIPTST